MKQMDSSVRCPLDRAATVIVGLSEGRTHRYCSMAGCGWAVRRMNQAQCDKVLDHLFALPVGEGVSGDREVPVVEGLDDGALPPQTAEGGDAA